MYDLIDRLTVELPTADRAVLDRLRRKVLATTMRTVERRSTRPDAFNLALEVIHAASSGSLIVQRPCADRVGEDEAVIVALWRLIRGSSLASAQATATGLVGACNATELVSHIAESLVGVR